MNEFLKTVMHAEFYTYMCILTASCILGFIRRKKFSAADKLFYILFIIALVTEIIAAILIALFHNNNWVYYIYSSVEMFFICRYYNQAVFLLKRYSIGTYLGMVSILFAIIDPIFFDNIKKNNSVYLIYEQFTVCCLSLISYYDLLKNDENNILRKAQFWFTSSAFLYSVYFLLIWGFEPLISRKWLGVSYLMISLGNVLYYLTCSIIFINYKKLIPSGTTE